MELIRSRNNKTATNEVKTLSKEQEAFFSEKGFVHLPGFFSETEIKTCLNEISRIQQELISTNASSVNGIPIYWGNSEQFGRFIHRMPFLSTFSAPISCLINSKKVRSLTKLLSGHSRLGEFEKDGLVLNQYSYVKTSKFKGMGWHTDCMRDLFYFRKTYPMLNIGIHLTNTTQQMGSLRVLPGTHKQNLWSLFTKKLYYLNNSDDKDEVEIITAKGDLTIHHGHIWHRVKPPVVSNDNLSMRKVMYIPVICDPIQIKNIKQTVKSCI